MDCFPDFCLACDNQTVDGLYCSQACRLADLERAGSAPHSPTTLRSDSSTNMWAITRRSPHRQSSYDHYKTSTDRPFTSTFPDARHSTPDKQLSPCSSRSSLISCTGASHSQCPVTLSEKACEELRSYFDSFDRAKQQKRQSLVSSKTEAKAYASHMEHTFADDF